MPLYTAITERGCVSDETKARIAEEITRIHVELMKVPKNFVRVLFLSYPKHSGYTAGEEASTAALNCVLRSGHTGEEKTELLTQTVVTIPGANGNRQRSAGLITPGSSVQQRHRDGSDHAGR